MDVDGTLTDGKIYMGSEGEVFKCFDVKDGCGIKDILPNYGIIPVIITARESEMVFKRFRELGVIHLYQGVRNKFNKLLEITDKVSEQENIQYSLSNIAYIGDDILDLECMIQIKEAGGIIGCPADAVKKVLDIADFVSKKKGGNGAVRDFIEYLVEE